MTDDERRTRTTGSDDDPGMPRWVTVFGVVVLVLVLPGALIMHTIGGEHGPGRHDFSRQR